MSSLHTFMKIALLQNPWGVHKFFSVGFNGLEVGYDCLFKTIPKSGF
jgi:hypothetical protein